MHPGATRILVDFARVGFCDFSGLYVLNHAYGHTTNRGVALRLIGGCAGYGNSSAFWTR